MGEQDLQCRMNVAGDEPIQGAVSKRKHSKPRKEKAAADGCSDEHHRLTNMPPFSVPQPTLLEEGMWHREKSVRWSRGRGLRVKQWGCGVRETTDRDLVKLCTVEIKSTSCYDDKLASILQTAQTSN